MLLAGGLAKAVPVAILYRAFHFFYIKKERMRRETQSEAGDTE